MFLRNPRMVVHSFSVTMDLRGMLPLEEIWQKLDWLIDGILEDSDLFEGHALVPPSRVCDAVKRITISAKATDLTGIGGSSVDDLSASQWNTFSVQEKTDCLLSGRIDILRVDYKTERDYITFDMLLTIEENEETPNFFDLNIVCYPELFQESANIKETLELVLKEFQDLCPMFGAETLLLGTGSFLGFEKARSDPSGWLSVL